MHAYTVGSMCGQWTAKVKKTKTNKQTNKQKKKKGKKKSES